MNHNHPREGYPQAENELPKRATYFVSFWWAIFWKEALVLLAASFVWRFSAAWFEGATAWRVLLALAIALGLCYFLRELFYAMLEKRYLRKGFTMIVVDKDGKFKEQRLEQAHALLWSFLWGHLSLVGIAGLICLVFAGGVALFEQVPFWSLLLAMLAALMDREVLVAWGVIFAIYPHYHLWTRRFFNLAGFRLALISG